MAPPDPNSTIKSAIVKSNSQINMRSADDNSAVELLRAAAADGLSKWEGYWTNHILSVIPVQSVSRIMYYNEIYKNIIDVPGVICEFGVQWGGGLAQLLHCRNFYEPHNVGRIIYGFDTFEGFVGTDTRDGSVVSEGDYKTADGYFSQLHQILMAHESFQPRQHVQKTFLIKGDAAVTIDNWLNDNPHAIISMAIFDMDIYKPTKVVLEKILPRLTKGSVLVFDELNHPAFPGETLALSEVIGLQKVRLRKTRWQPHSSYLIWE